MAVHYFRAGPDRYGEPEPGSSARFLAASIIADSEEELAELMDDVNLDNLVE
ncbi:MAG: hypothetical protein LBF95_10720 [Treponema sp.]|jgi:hypothetical protein|nr:hypothetical protein [Treponema sp.]